MRPSLLITCLLLAAGTAHADEDDEPPSDLGFKVAAIPILDYGSDEGLGFGAHFRLTEFGDGTRRPYVYSIEGNVFATTGGIQEHWLALDLPHIGGSPYRVTLRAGYERAKFQPYYGLGNGSVRDEDADRCDDASLQQQLPAAPNVCASNPAFRGRRFYSYDLEVFPSLQLTVIRSIGGPWSLLFGYQFLLVGFQPLYRPDDLGQDTGSQLSADASAGRLVEWDGQLPQGDPYHRFRQRYAELVGGVRFDTRDNEFAPTRGCFTSCHSAVPRTRSKRVEPGRCQPDAPVLPAADPVVLAPGLRAPAPRGRREQRCSLLPVVRYWRHQRGG